MGQVFVAGDIHLSRLPAKFLKDTLALPHLRPYSGGVIRHCGQVHWRVGTCDPRDVRVSQHMCFARGLGEGGAQVALEGVNAREEREGWW